MTVILIVTLFAGTAASVNRKLDKAMDAYYSADDGYGDINEYFKTSLECARSILKLSKSVGVDKSYLNTFEGYITTAEKAKTPADKFSAMQKLFLETEALYSQIKNTKPDTTDSDTADRLYFEITGNAQRVNNVTSIRRDSYNEAADSFNEKVLGSFPLKLYYGLLGFEKLEKIY